MDADAQGDERRAPQPDEVPPELVERVAALGVADPEGFWRRPVPAFSGRSLLAVLGDEDGPARVDAHLATVAAVLGTGDAGRGTAAGEAEAVAPPAPAVPAPTAGDGAPPGRVTWQLLVGSAVAIALAVGVLVVVRRHSADVASRGADLRPQEVPSGRPGDAAAFVSASERSRKGTWFVVEEFTRSVGGTAALGDRTTRAQRGLDASLLRGGGNLQLVVGDRETVCAADPDQPDRLRCRSGPNLRAARQAQLEQDLDGLRDLLLGPAPLYAVTVPRPGCFELRIRTQAIAPPYGRRATICFDPQSGAPTSAEVEKEGGAGRPLFVDATRAVEVRTEVTDADLALPANAVVG